VDGTLSTLEQAISSSLTLYPRGEYLKYKHSYDDHLKDLVYKLPGLTQKLAGFGFPFEESSPSSSLSSPEIPATVQSEGGSEFSQAYQAYQTARKEYIDAGAEYYKYYMMGGSASAEPYRQRVRWLTIAREKQTVYEARKTKVLQLQNKAMEQPAGTASNEVLNAVIDTEDPLSSGKALGRRVHV